MKAKHLFLAIGNLGTGPGVHTSELLRQICFFFFFKAHVPSSRELVGAVSPKVFTKSEQEAGSSSPSRSVLSSIPTPLLCHPRQISTETHIPHNSTCLVGQQEQAFLAQIGLVSELESWPSSCFEAL
ncbi:hypothetical protein OIU79_016900 [Salix purpurea]|uniref:Uncharacterized protein n=1 Tax=Salix purpurea TaxID=77065 RepID=A0A9Q0PFH8_SALPP|nr:hypothetical protein OIU79_016900 [Salix purpurea]